MGWACAFLDIVLPSLTSLNLICRMPTNEKRKIMMTRVYIVMRSRRYEVFFLCVCVCVGGGSGKEEQ